MFVFLLTQTTVRPRHLSVRKQCYSFVKHQNMGQWTRLKTLALAQIIEKRSVFKSHRFYFFYLYTRPLKCYICSINESKNFKNLKIKFFLLMVPGIGSFVFYCRAALTRNIRRCRFVAPRNCRAV